MKAITALLICLTLSGLTACGGGECDPATDVSPQADNVTATATPEPTAVPEPTPEPKPALTPAPTDCNKNTICWPNPTPAPIRIVTTEPNPTPACIRNAEPLMYVAPFWVDNCGTRYGIVTQ